VNAPGLGTWYWASSAFHSFSYAFGRPPPPYSVGPVIQPKPASNFLPRPLAGAAEVVAFVGAAALLEHRYLVGAFTPHEAALGFLLGGVGVEELTGLLLERFGGDHVRTLLVAVSTIEVHLSHRWQSMSMDLNGYLAVLATEATTLAAAAEEAGLGANVPTCPGWSVADLVLHLGEVHRWATATVASNATKLSDVPTDYLGAVPEAADAIHWFRDGATKLCDTLAAADPSIDYAVFLHDPMTPHLLFWARRQTMETSMHRVDAESAGRPVHRLRPRRRRRRIDEFLTGFLPRSRTTLHTETPRNLQIAPDYSDRRWTVSIGPELPVTTRQASAADCTITGSASDIYLALWNRTSVDSLCITGDRSMIDLLRDNVRIRWG